MLVGRLRFETPRQPPRGMELKQLVRAKTGVGMRGRVVELLVTSERHDRGPVVAIDDLVHLDADFRVQPHPLHLLAHDGERVQEVLGGIQVEEERHDVQAARHARTQAGHAAPGRGRSDIPQRSIRERASVSIARPGDRGERLAAGHGHASRENTADLVLGPTAQIGRLEQIADQGRQPHLGNGQLDAGTKIQHRRIFDVQHATRFFRGRLRRRVQSQRPHRDDASGRRQHNRKVSPPVTVARSRRRATRRRDGCRAGPAADHWSTASRRDAIRSAMTCCSAQAGAWACTRPRPSSTTAPIRRSRSGSATATPCLDAKRRASSRRATSRTSGPKWRGGCADESASNLEHTSIIRQRANDRQVEDMSGAGLGTLDVGTRQVPDGSLHFVWREDAVDDLMAFVCSNHRSWSGRMLLASSTRLLRTHTLPPKEGRQNGEDQAHPDLPPDDRRRPRRPSDEPGVCVEVIAHRAGNDEHDRCRCRAERQPERCPHAAP